MTESPNRPFCAPRFHGGQPNQQGGEGRQKHGVSRESYGKVMPAFHIGITKYEGLFGEKWSKVARLPWAPSLSQPTGVGSGRGLLDPGVGSEDSSTEQGPGRGERLLTHPSPLLRPKAQACAIYFPSTTLPGRFSWPRNQKPFVSEPQSIATNPKTSEKRGEL